MEEEVVAPAGELGSWRCSICFEEMQYDAKPGSRKEPVVLQCSPKIEECHKFHRQCIDEWVRGPQKINKRCPVCKKDPFASHKQAQALAATKARLRRKETMRGKLEEAVKGVMEATDTFVLKFQKELMPVAAFVFFIVIVVVLLLLFKGQRTNQKIEK